MTYDPSPHVHDSELTRLLDGEPFDAPALRHIAECERCDNRRAFLGQASSGFSAWIMETRPLLPTPPSDLWLRIRTRAPTSRARPRLHPAVAAALASVILVGALTAEPTRIWLGARLGDLSRLMAPAPPVQPEPSVPAAHVSVAFVPEGPDLVVTFDRAPAEGRLVVSFEGGREARVDIETEGSAPPVTVRADGFRIRTTNRSGGTIRLRVPASIETVRLVLGDRESRVVRPPNDTVVEFPVGAGGG